MIDEKKLKEVTYRVKNFIAEGLIETKQKKEYVKFFITNAENSLNTAKALFELSTDNSKQESMGFTHFDGLL